MCEKTFVERCEFLKQ